MTSQDTYFHVAFVVEDLERAMERFGAALGLEWRPIMEFPVRLREDGAVKSGTSRAVYSAGGPPAIELFEPVETTALTSTNGASFHHIGLWAPDLATRSRQLQTAGCPLASTVAGRSDAPKGFALHATDLGFYVELCDPESLRRAAELAGLVPESL